ncbi:MAG TPA: cytochrome P450 [Blastocatellia bacterium]|nr:cytochrome P450 [Blastocatellia bacterium]
MKANAETSERRARAFPLGRAVTLERLSVDPYPILAQLRAAESVSWIPEVGMWFVTRRDDVLTVLRDRETFTTDEPSSLLRETFGAHMLSTEGRQQARYKSQCFPPFRPEAIERRAVAIIKAKAHALVDAFAQPAELRTAFASPLALHTVATVLGIPAEDHELLRPLYDDFAAALANFAGDAEVKRRGAQARERFSELVEAHLARLEREPDDSLLSVLSHASDRLSRAEIISNALLILFGGIETTESMILNALYALLTHRDQMAEVLRAPALLGQAIEESLRWDAAVQSCTRHLTRSVTLRGVELDAGETVQCMLGAANRDPDYFADPDRFDIHRQNAADHLSFGFGSHFCLGAPLARMEAQLGLQILFSRLPGLAFDPERPGAPRGHEFRKPPELYVTWTN